MESATFVLGLRSPETMPDEGTFSLQSGTVYLPSATYLKQPTSDVNWSKIRSTKISKQTKILATSPTEQFLSFKIATKFGTEISSDCDSNLGQNTSNEFVVYIGSLHMENISSNNWFLADYWRQMGLWLVMNRTWHNQITRSWTII